MRITNKDRARLSGILHSLKRGIGFVLDEKTALMRKHNLCSSDVFESQYPPYKGEKWTKTTKEIGCEFALAISAMNDLEKFLAPGCGVKMHVAGTNGGQMPCGCELTELDGSTKRQFCDYCKKLAKTL